MILDTGHSAYQLSQAKVWSTFSVPDPIQLNKLAGDTYILTSHDSENSCTLMRIDPETGFYDKQRIDSQNLKVFATCLLNSGVQG